MDSWNEIHALVKATTLRAFSRVQLCDAFLCRKIRHFEQDLHYKSVNTRILPIFKGLFIAGSATPLRLHEASSCRRGELLTGASSCSWLLMIGGARAHFSLSRALSVENVIEAAGAPFFPALEVLTIFRFDTTTMTTFCNSSGGH
jgi:hypothetical protein